MLKLEVSNLGPINEGTVELRPLTIFVGPNNTGKSYLATLIYALFHSLPTFAGRFWFPRYRWRAEMTRGLEKPMVSELINFLTTLIKQSEFRDDSKPFVISLADLPQEFKLSLGSAVEAQFKETARTILANELKRCYGKKIAELVRKPVLKRNICITIEQEKPQLRAQLSCSNNTIEVKSFSAELESVSVPIPLAIVREAERGEELSYFFLRGLSFSLFRSFSRDMYYLPAARSGILQSHKLLASIIVRRAPLVGIEPIEAPPGLSGIVADFIVQMLGLEKRKKPKFNQITSFLETEVMQGQVDIKAEKLEYPEIYYKRAKDEFPLHTTSSMISELAPLVLLLKYVVDPGDVLIIEEPESHLHPEAQLKLARAIVKLVRAKVTVLITTHSDYFIQQLSNFLRAAQLTDEERVGQGYDSDDYLKPDEVSAYLFEVAREGSLIKPIQVSAEEGISDEEFARVNEALYEKTVYLQRRVMA